VDQSTLLELPSKDNCDWRLAFGATTLGERLRLGLTPFRHAPRALAPLVAGLRSYWVNPTGLSRACSVVYSERIVRRRATQLGDAARAFQARPVAASHSIGFHLSRNALHEETGADVFSDDGPVVVGASVRFEGGLRSCHGVPDAIINVKREEAVGQGGPC